MARKTTCSNCEALRRRLAWTEEHYRAAQEEAAYLAGKVEAFRAYWEPAHEEPYLCRRCRQPYLAEPDHDYTECRGLDGLCAACLEDLAEVRKLERAGL